MTYQFTSVGDVVSTEVPGLRTSDPFITQLLSIGTLTPAQARIVASMQGPPRSVAAHTQLAHTDSSASIHVIREGWAFAYTLLANGDRQVVGFLLPGDIVRLGCPVRGNTELGIETITDTIVTQISGASVRDESRDWPEIFLLFLRLQSEFVAALVGQLVDLGRRDSRARVARLLLKLERRLELIGASRADGYDCPLNQYLIADALGLTAIHVNRVLRGFREEGILTFRRNRVTIHDRARLIAVAGDDEDDGEVAPVAVAAKRRRERDREAALAPAPYWPPPGPGQSAGRQGT